MQPAAEHPQMPVVADPVMIGHKPSDEVFGQGSIQVLTGYHAGCWLIRIFSDSYFSITTPIRSLVFVCRPYVLITFGNPDNLKP